MLDAALIGEDLEQGGEIGLDADPQQVDELDLAAQLRELKAASAGELLVVGSVALARWLLEQELVDELNLIQFPVIVGQGDAFLPRDGRDFALDLTDARVFPSGIVALTYGVGGRPRYA